jgi:hypothetical protein
MRDAKRELISCHDCGEAISFSAVACPNCGSREPTGLQVFSTEETRRQVRNDHTLAVTVLACGAAGVLYGVAWSFDLTSAVVGGLVYGIAGMLVGVPIGFAIIVTSWVVGD